MSISFDEHKNIIITASQAEEFTADIVFGYWNEEGLFQAIDLSGESPVDVGLPLAVQPVVFDSGMPPPSYGGMILPEGITVTSADVKDGVFYIDAAGEKQEGTMTVHGDVTVTLSDSRQILDSGYYDRIVIPAKPAPVTFYRCAEYSPAAGDLLLTSGAATLADGTTKISLRGVYRKQSNYRWLCAETEAFDDYISAEVYINKMVATNGVYTSVWLEIVYDSVIAIGSMESKYIKDILFSARNSAILNERLSLTTDSETLDEFFSGYAITLEYPDKWEESTELTTGLSPKGYTPEPGKIYSAQTYTLINSRYPDAPDEAISFYECKAIDNQNGTWTGNVLVSNLSNPVFEVKLASPVQLNGIYFIAGYDNGSLRTKVFSNGQYYLRTYGLKWVISDTAEEKEDSSHYFESEEFNIYNIPLPSEAVWPDNLKVTATPAGWVRTGKEVTDLPIKGYTPEIGKVYSADSSLEINNAFPEHVKKHLKFYECVNYIPEADAYTKYSITLSGAADEKANGTYVRTVWVEDVPESEWIDAPVAVWTNENGYSFKEYFYSEYNYFIYNNSGESVYYSNEPYWSRVNDYSRILWWSEIDAADVNLAFSSVETEDMPAVSESWSGYLILQNHEDGTWSKTDQLIEGLEAKGYMPKPGKIYSVDSTVECTGLFVPAEGSMVALYHFDGDCVDATGNTTATLNGKSIDTSKFRFGHSSLYGDCYMDSSNGVTRYYLKITGLPELDAFTVEWWQYDNWDYGDGSSFLSQPETDDLPVSIFPALVIPKEDPEYITGKFKHWAFVREAGAKEVSVYLNGKNMGSVDFKDKLGGRVIHFTGVGSVIQTQTKASYIDELAFFDYPKYRKNFTVPDKQYEL